MSPRRSGPGPDRTAALMSAAAGAAPLTCADVAALGITRAQLRAAVAAETVRRGSRGMYVVIAAGSDPRAMHIQQGLAATRALPNSVVSHTSALVCHGLPLPGRAGVPPSPHLTIPTSRWRSGPTARVHTSPLDAEDVTTLVGLRVTTVARTAIDMARRSSIFDAQMLIDAAARLLMGTRGPQTLAVRDLRARVHDEAERDAAAHQLRDVLSRQIGWPGIRRARRAVGWAEPASESPQSLGRGFGSFCGICRPLCAEPR